MTREERTVADFAGTGLTLGVHPVGFYRAELDALHVLSAARLASRRDGERVRIAGCVICRQRPGTAKGFLFLSLEDETGIANAIVTPDIFDQHRATLVTAPYLLLEGRLQNQQGAISVKVDRAEPLALGATATPSHDFR